MTDEQRRRGGVFFDADGTLPGTNYLHVAAWREAFTMSSRLSPARTSSSGR
jgi:beta-phosphoglucomutase-like phosphatase (HAD superfamily)